MTKQYSMIIHLQRFMMLKQDKSITHLWTTNSKYFQIKWTQQWLWVGLVFPVDTHIELILEWGSTERKLTLCDIFRKLLCNGKRCMNCDNGAYKAHSWKTLNEGYLGFHIKFTFLAIEKKNLTFLKILL